MSTYPVERLLRLWWRAEIIAERRWPFRRGHMLQHIAALEAQGLALQKQVWSLQQAIKPLKQP